MRPIFQVSGPTGAFTGPGGRGLTCTVVDQSLGELDKAIIEVDDRDGELAIPTGQISVSMGYQETGLFFMGTFDIETVSLIGWPQRMKIIATSADMLGPLKSQVNDVGHNMSLSKWLYQVANKAGINSVKVGPEFAAIQNKFWQQTKESPMHLFTRLANKYDATAKITNGQLVFMKRGAGLAASGVGLAGGVAEFPFNVKQYSASFNVRNAYQGATGNTLDMKMGEAVEQTAPPLPTRNPLNRAGGATTTVNTTPFHADGEHEAEEVASARADTLGRKEGTLLIAIIGDPTIFAQSPLNVINVRPEVDGEWSIVTVTHRIDESGFDTTIDAQFPLVPGGVGGPTLAEHQATYLANVQSQAPHNIR